MPLPAEFFYSKENTKNTGNASSISDESERRWPRPRFISEIEVPPSLLSEPLSAPGSGFSPPKTSSSGLKPPLKKKSMQPIRTRFTKALMNVQDRWQWQLPGPISAQQVLCANANRSNKELSAAAALISLPDSKDRCSAWVQSVSTDSTSSRSVIRKLDFEEDSDSENIPPHAKPLKRKRSEDKFFHGDTPTHGDDDSVDLFAESENNCGQTPSSAVCNARHTNGIGSDYSADLFAGYDNNCGQTPSSAVCNARHTNGNGSRTSTASSERPVRSLTKVTYAAKSDDSDGDTPGDDDSVDLFAESDNNCGQTPSSAVCNTRHSNGKRSRISTASSGRPVRSLTKVTSVAKSDDRDRDTHGDDDSVDLFAESDNNCGQTPSNAVRNTRHSDGNRSRISTASSGRPVRSLTKVTYAAKSDDSDGDTPGDDDSVDLFAESDNNCGQTPSNAVCNTRHSNGKRSRISTASSGRPVRSLTKVTSAAKSDDRDRDTYGDDDSVDLFAESDNNCGQTPSNAVRNTRHSNGNRSRISTASSGRPVRSLTKVTYAAKSDDSDASESLFSGCDDDDDGSDPGWTVGNFGQPSEDEDSENSNSANEDDEGQESDEQPITPRKVTKKQLRAARKLKRNSGQAYVSSSGVSVDARERKPVHNCKRLKCQNIITEEIGNAIFSEYWAMSSYEKRVNYVCSRVVSQTIQRARRRLEFSNRGKKFSHKYYFDINGSRYQVCKSTFLDVLGETDTFLRLTVQKKSETTTGIGPNERRGKVTPKHALTEEAKQRVLDHINSYPAYMSHYCRKQTKQKYLSSELTLQKMCNQFNEENMNLKVSYSTYRRIFKPLKLKFKEPATDTCAKCDEFRAKLKYVKSEEERKDLESKYELHLRRAEAAYALKTHYTKLAKTDKTIKVLIFDLEQVFSTPNVTCGMAYYLRQLSTYNLTIVDAGTGKTFNCMWHEGEAARGASQIASCIFQHVLNEVGDDKVELFLFSDCCSGQNRNSLVATMFHILLCLHASLKVINHIFLVPGHTRLECDSKHSVIERRKKHAGLISVPSQWYEVVNNVGESFEVVEMADKFVDFAPVLDKNGPLIMRQKLESGNKMYWTKTHWFQYRASKPGIVEVKASFSEDAPFECYNMVRGMCKSRKLQDSWWSVAKPVAPGNGISQEKKANLMSLLPYIDESYHDFYKELKVDGAITEDTDPDLPSENEEESDED